MINLIQYLKAITLRLSVIAGPETLLKTLNLCGNRELERLFKKKVMKLHIMKEPIYSETGTDVMKCIKMR